jgi:hypothetical protein
MSEYVLFDEFRLVFLVPRDLEDSAGVAIRRVLERRRFRAALRRAVRQIINHYPDLAPVRLRLSV